MTSRAKATTGILVGLLLAALDGTVVATALPTIADDLGGLGVYFLPVAVFMLCQTVSMPIWGRLSDLHGRARYHLLAVGMLVGASALCGIARGMADFTAYRALQGIGAGGIMALSFTMVGDLYQGDARARMQGAITAVWGVASVVGPPLGGWITHAWSWRGIFYLNVPVGVLSALLVRLTWKDEKRGVAGRIDLPGAVLLAAASAAALAGCGLAAKRGDLALAAFGTAAVFLAALVVVERRAADPFLAYDLFRIRLFAAGAATGVCALVCLFAAVLHVPFFVQGVLGENVQWAGRMLTVMMVPWMICSAMTRRLLKLGYRTISVAGLAACAGAFWMLARLGRGDALGDVAAAMVVLGAGLGMTVAPLLIAAQNAVPRERLGAATSLTQFSRSMGGAVALAVMGAILGTALGGGNPDGVIRERAELSPERLEAVVSALEVGLRRIFWLGAGTGAVGMLLALALPGRPRRA